MTTLDFLGDVGCTQRMFDAVDTIELRATAADPTPSGHVDYPPEDGHLSVLATVDMRIRTRETLEEGARVFGLVGDTATFIFAPVSTVRPVTYSIVYQQDHGS